MEGGGLTPTAVAPAGGAVPATPVLPPIDWTRPWFAPWRGAGEAAAAAVSGGARVCDALNANGTSPVRFVPQDALPAGQAYERHIFETATCPTREGLHDFFNGLCWMAMPQSKRRLNALQAAEIGRQGVGAVRGPVRDAITVFDENGALLAAPEPLWEALLARQWRRLFVELRPLWSQARLVLFGHALLEKLVQPRKDMTAHVWRVPAPLSLITPEGSHADAASSAAARSALAGWDEWLAAQLTAPALASKPFTPLPVLGVPGWCPDSEDPAFYEDAQVFRPARRPAASASR